MKRFITLDLWGEPSDRRAKSLVAPDAIGSIHPKRQDPYHSEITIDGTIWLAEQTPTQIVKLIEAAMTEVREVREELPDRTATTVSTRVGKPEVDRARTHAQQEPAAPWMLYNKLENWLRDIYTELMRRDNIAMGHSVRLDLSDLINRYAPVVGDKAFETTERVMAGDRTTVNSVRRRVMTEMPDPTDAPMVDVELIKQLKLLLPGVRQYCGHNAWVSCARIIEDMEKKS